MTLRFVALLGLAAIAIPAAAAPVRPFERAAFEAAQARNQPVLIFVHAPWCPVCRVQTKAVEDALAQPAYRNLQVFRIDFDTQKPLWQSFGATQQSTLIGFHGKRETGRLAHDTDVGRINAVLAGTLG